MPLMDIQYNTISGLVMQIRPADSYWTDNERGLNNNNLSVVKLNIHSSQINPITKHEYSVDHLIEPTSIYKLTNSEEIHQIRIRGKLV